jgi:hypothetical protein
VALHLFIDLELFTKHLNSSKPALFQAPQRKRKRDKGNMATTAVASVAAISGLAAYLNGKYHLKQDIKLLRAKKEAAKYYEQLGTSPVPLQPH